MADAPALRMRGLDAGYGRVTVLRGVDLEVARGAVVGVFGANGAGKTTLLRTVSRLTEITAGTLEVGGDDVRESTPLDMSLHRGVAHVPEGRRVFRGMSVEENLLVAAGTGRRRAAARLEEVYEIFPRLGERERRRQRAESLSGGEQQMLAIGRALMMGPRLIMMDEPSQGLSPAAVETVVSSVTRIAQSGVTVIVVEQNVPVLLPVVTAAVTVSLGTVRPTARAELETDETLSGLLGGTS